MDSVNNFGVTKTLFLLGSITGQGVIYWMYYGRINDKQKEIDRIAIENREYRERLLQLMDRATNYKKPKKITTKKKGGK
jgi:hypothetical protein